MFRLREGLTSFGRPTGHSLRSTFNSSKNKEADVFDLDINQIYIEITKGPLFFSVAHEIF
jgi:hypothetical protein